MSKNLNLEAREALAGVQIVREPIARLLQDLGYDLTGTSSSVLMLLATDLLVAVELAQTLPPEADFPAALACLHSFEHQAPATLREVQQRLLDELEREFTAEIETAQSPLAVRLKQLRSRVEEKSAEDLPA